MLNSPQEITDPQPSKALVEKIEVPDQLNQIPMHAPSTTQGYPQMSQQMSNFDEQDYDQHQQQPPNF